MSQFFSVAAVLEAAAAFVAVVLLVAVVEIVAAAVIVAAAAVEIVAVCNNCFPFGQSVSQVQQAMLYIAHTRHPREYKNVRI
ncbi:MAG: hypothetical protein J6T60_13225 [Bacteroidales bacterium]|nr:hypothetical protein [Bacteroidales bacterium]